jgi:hypothetical protein
MQKIILYSFIAVILFSCTKSTPAAPGTNPTPPPVTTTPPPVVNDTPVKTFSVYDPQQHAKIVETIAYNSYGQLDTIKGNSYDSLGGTIVVDSFLLSFIQSNPNNPPAGYDVIYHNNGDLPAGEAEHHLLFYDYESRVSLDSLATTNTNIFWSQHYFYDGVGNASVQWWIPDPTAPAGYMISQTDTMYTQGGNILRDINYTTTVGEFNRLFTRTYSTNINPLYSASIANSLGPLLVFNNYGDYRSPNLPSQYTDQGAGQLTIMLNYVWTTDSNGKVIQGVGTDVGGTTVEQIYSFSY